MQKRRYWSDPGLCQCVIFEKKSATNNIMTTHFFAREIVDDRLQVCISKNLILHAY